MKARGKGAKAELVSESDFEPAADEETDPQVAQIKVLFTKALMPLALEKARGCVVGTRKREQSDPPPGQS